MSAAASIYDLPGGSDAPGRIRGHSVGHRIEIAAPPELVWDFVADFEGWQGWNPLYVATQGDARPGGQVRFTVRLEGLKPQTASAKVLTVQPPELLEYAVTSLGGLLKTFRYVEIEEVSPVSCIVTNGEIMGGPLGRVVSRALGDKVGRGLEAINLALRTMAERKWRGRPT